MLQLYYQALVTISGNVPTRYNERANAVFLKDEGPLESFDEQIPMIKYSVELEQLISSFQNLVIRAGDWNIANTKENLVGVIIDKKLIYQ